MAKSAESPSKGGGVIALMHRVDMVAQRIAGFADLAALGTGDAGMVEMQRLNMADDVVFAPGFAAHHAAPEARAVLLHHSGDEAANGRVQFGRRRREGFAWTQNI